MDWSESLAMPQTSEDQVQTIRNELLESRGDLERGRPANPFALNCQKITNCYLRTTNITHSKKKKYLAIALISLSKISDYKTVSYWTPDSAHGQKHCLRQLIKLGKKDERDRFKLYKQCITWAIENNADIVCMNELGLPTYQGKPKKKALKWTQDIANKSNTLIVGGSCHHHGTLYNSTAIFLPGENKSPIWYRKQVSATGLKDPELVSVPTYREVPIIEAFGFHIAVITCLDILDYSSVAPIVQCRDKCDLLLLPSYSSSVDAINGAAKVIANVLPGAVGFVNYFADGIISSILYQFDSTAKVSMRKLFGEASRVNIFRIEKVEFDRQRRGLKHSMDGDWKWLFGTLRAR